jgi:hypothetical protein
LTEFFEGAVGSGTFAPRRKVTHRSKRLSKAMANLRRAVGSDDDVQEISPRQMATKRKRPVQDIVKVESESDDAVKDDALEESSSSDDDNNERMRSSVAPKRRSAKRDSTPKESKRGRRKKLKV